MSAISIDTGLNLLEPTSGAESGTADDEEGRWRGGLKLATSPKSTTSTSARAKARSKSKSKHKHKRSMRSGDLRTHTFFKHSVTHNIHRHTTYDIRHTTYNTQHTTQHNTQHTTHNNTTTQHTTHNTQHTTHNNTTTQHTTTQQHEHRLVT